MRLKVVAIGNSRGLRIPKPLLEQAGIGDEVEVESDGDRLVLRAVSARARQGWAEAFQQMAANGDDTLLDVSDRPSSWDEDEWEWK